MQIASSHTIIIPVYNSHDLVRRLIEDVPISIPVIIVDNSDIPFLSVFPNVTIYRTAPKIGYGRAVNLGIYFALKRGFTKAIICNQDVRFAKGSITILFSALNEQNPQIYLPLTQTYEGEEIESYNLDFYGEDFVSDLKNDAIKHQYLLHNIGFVCFAIQFQPWMQYGVFDPIYPMYFEDTDFVQRWKIYKGQLFLLPSAKIHHLGSSHSNPYYTDNYPFVYSKALHDLRWERKPLYLCLLYLFKKSIKALLRGQINQLCLIKWSMIKLIWRRNSARNSQNFHIHKRIKTQTLNDVSKL